MRNDEYEKTYRAAREVLYLRGKKIGRLIYGQDGLRYCVVGGLSLSDREVFKEAWSETTADEILKDLAECISPYPHGCRECDELWEEYDRATAGYLEIFTIQRIAADKRDSADLAGVRSLFDHAGEIRRAARKSVRDHFAAHVCVHTAGTFIESRGSKEEVLSGAKSTLDNLYRATPQFAQPLIV